MSLWSRITNVFRSEPLNREFDEEMQTHLDEARERGRADFQRAFGSTLRLREESRDIKISAWLDSLRADVVFGFRHLRKNKAVSAAAVLSLALAIGACTSAFRLVDAVLLRPLPVSDPDRLFFLAYATKDRAGNADTADSYEYPFFRVLRAAVKDQAELMAISYSSRIDLTYGSEQDIEKAYRQYVSGWTFSSFGLKPATGRLLTTSDDLKPGAHPYAVLSYDYWTRRFGRDPKAVGRTFRIGDQIYDIVGVLQQGFTGTETGTMTDIFIPTMMNAKAIEDPNWGWFRTWVRLKPESDPKHIRQKLQTAFSTYRRDLTKTWSADILKIRADEYVNAPLTLERASAGVSGLQRDYRSSLFVIVIVAALVLLIACANVANLLTAQASSRAREMALRVSIGAGRGRLVQLVMVESALLAVVSSLIGTVFAWWPAPFVVTMINPLDNPARLVLPADWRILGFGVLLAAAVTFLFGLLPALRASSVKPMSAIRGGEDPHSKRRLMHSLIAAQVAFCFLIHFVAGLFIATFDRLAQQPTGFQPQGLLILETVTKPSQPPERWDQVLETLRSVPGVQSIALSGWPLMSGNTWTSNTWLNGQLMLIGNSNPYFLSVSPGWFDTMRIPLIEGRQFRPEDIYPGTAIVNEAFARQMFAGQSAIGKSFENFIKNKKVPTTIVGVIRDARYRDMREQPRPTVYVPFRASDVAAKNWGSYMVRTDGANPMAMAPALRKQVSAARSEFRVTNTTTQEELVARHTIRERLLAILSLFFAIVALILAGVGLYGVLNYSVLQRRREIGIRMALGAPAAEVVRRVTVEVFGALLAGAAAGLLVGLVSETYLAKLLYGIHATDPAMVAIPIVTILIAAVVGALPPAIHAVRIDPASTLRAE